MFHKHELHVTIISKFRIKTEEMATTPYIPGEMATITNGGIRKCDA